MFNLMIKIFKFALKVERRSIGYIHEDFTQLLSVIPDIPKNEIRVILRKFHPIFGKQLLRIIRS